MTEPTLVRELFEIPEHIRKGDFVLKLTEGVENPHTTAETYVVTPGLVQAFDQALGLVGSALRDGRSQAAYLHGSFGSGKSHFMALLSLLLRGNEEAWRISDLHPLREKHSFVGQKNLLELHFHMIGQESLESAIFSGYLAHVRAAHPDAVLPGLFADEKLFENAGRLLAKLGDDAFFAPMNEGAGASSDWGDLGASWDAERFRAAVASADPDVRQELFSALVKSHFQGWEQGSKSFIDLDSGLATMTRHAARLGYDAIVLFLDELILWLASRAADAAWLHVEAQKMVKLVEAADMHRDIPLVSFIARQRNLAELVGEDYAGVENLRLNHSLKHWEGRYDTVRLEDRNLPAIVERRILKTRDEAARRVLDDAFEKLRRTSGNAWNTLLAAEDQSAFRLLYPFSPALVDVLVALSSSLQRQRTAIKLLMEMLVEHINDLTIGEVVRVGDLFDVLAAGQESADGIMRTRFEAARQMYRYQFLPLIQRQNGTDSEAKCQRLRPEHPTRLGCSNCPQRACRSDNRLVKTLLIAALVPEVDAVKDLTAAKLVQLNHGSLKVPIPGTEATLVAQRLRSWAAEVGQLQVGNENDPRVRLRLEGVDLGPILDRARHADNTGARQRVLRDLLFEALGLENVFDKNMLHKVDWRGTTRQGHVHFGNIRTMSPEALRCPEEDDWRLVIDYPFDERSFGPNDDLEALERFRETGAGSWTLAWLPSFLSDPMDKLLGELVILEHILATKETARELVKDLSVENQSRALMDLETLRSSKKARLFQVLEQAYGLAQPKEGDLDSSRTLDQHTHVLRPGARLQVRLPPNFAEAVQVYVEDLLAARWPRHPKLSSKLTRRRVEQLVEVFGHIIDAEDKKLPAERSLIDEVRGTLGELGLVRVTENAIHLVEDRLLQDLENRRVQRAIDQPSVGQLRQWLDEGGKLGLQADAEDLIARCYARWSARTFVHYGKPYVPEAGKAMPEEVVLEKPQLPGHAEWARALELAGFTFGITLPGRALHADNLKRFESALSARLAEVAPSAEKLPGLLELWAPLVGADAQADRLRTARSAAALCAALLGQPAVRQVEILAGFHAETSERAVGRSLGSAKAVAQALGESLVFGQFEALDRARQTVSGASELLDKAAQTLRQDEINGALAERVRVLAVEAQAVLNPPKPPPPPGIRISVDRKVEPRRALTALVESVEAELRKLGDDAELSGELYVTTKKRPR
jgi:hypothetical protein